MALSIADQIALDDALVAPADRLKIGKCNLRLSSDITSKEATLQVVYDVLKLTPFYKAFQVTADAPEIYMQEFWASAYVHNRSVRFKMNNKKHIIGLEQFRDILQICPKVGLIFKMRTNVHKKGSAMYYPRFTKLVVNYVMEKDPSIPRRNKVNWHYARDDPMFSTINVISRNEATQLYGAILPVALTNEDIRNSESYKEYYAMASGTIPPKTKGSKKKANTDAIPKPKSSTAPKKKKSGTGKQKTSELENISEAELTEAEQLKVVLKRSRLETHSSHASGSGADEGTGITPGVPDAPDYDSDDDISWKSSDDDQDDEQDQDDDDAEKHEVHETTQEEEDDDQHDDDENDQEDDDASDDDKKIEDDDDEEMTESDNDGDDFVHPKLTTHEDEIIHEKDTDEDDSSISSLKALEDTFSEFRQTNQYADALSSIPGTVDQYLANKMQEAVNVAVQLKYDRFREESTSANQQFLDSIDDGMKKIIKKEVRKEVSKIIPKVEKLVTDQLESEVLVRSS
ncbi:hypothetical protein Tco_0987820, partial [Tanacetum coccineum]